jgi:conjugative relaxase-like TrwC/TraI family protein
LCVTVSIARVSAGRGYEYLMRSVAVDDGRRDGGTPLTRYYTASGNPPGRWLGTGLAGLGDGVGLAAGSEVSERQMFRLFGQGMDPVSGECLGLRPYRTAPGAGRGSVAGFDLTFSVPKSVSVLWGLADAGLQEQIAGAHHAAVAAALRFVEAQVAATRVGRDGVAQAEVRGLLAAAFDHWDSRANDPNLHTHVVIANRVQALDGVWRTLDSRALYRAVVAISETYNGLLADELTRRLAVAWEPRERRRSAAPAWEIAGVPAELMRLFAAARLRPHERRSAGRCRVVGRGARRPATVLPVPARPGPAPRGRRDRRLRLRAGPTGRPGRHRKDRHPRRPAHGVGA